MTKDEWETKQRPPSATHQIHAPDGSPLPAKLGPSAQVDRQAKYLGVLLEEYFPRAAYHLGEGEITKNAKHHPRIHN